MSQSEGDSRYSAASGYSNRGAPRELSEAEQASLDRMKRVGLWAGGLALLAAMVLGLGPILNGNTPVRDSDWRVVDEVSVDDVLVADELAGYKGTPSEITVGDWTFKLYRGKLEARANSGELEGTVDKIGVGTTPVSLLEIDGWVIVGNNGGSIGGQISGPQPRSISFVDPASRVVAQTVTIGDEPLYQAEFLKLLEVDGNLWVVSKVEQMVWIIAPS